VKTNDKNFLVIVGSKMQRCTLGSPATEEETNNRYVPVCTRIWPQSPPL